MLFYLSWWTFKLRTTQTRWQWVRIEMFNTVNMECTCTTNKCNKCVWNPRLNELSWLVWFETIPYFYNIYFCSLKSCFMGYTLTSYWSHVNPIANHTIWSYCNWRQWWCWTCLIYLNMLMVIMIIMIIIIQLWKLEDCFTTWSYKIRIGPKRTIVQHFCDPMTHFYCLGGFVNKVASSSNEFDTMWIVTGSYENPSSTHNYLARYHIPSGNLKNMDLKNPWPPS